MLSFKIALLGFLLVLPVTTPGSPTSTGELLVAVELETRDNTLDGCTACGCRAKGELRPREKQNWWVAFGLVQPDAENGWVEADASSRCGVGSFAKIAADFNRTIGIPYVVLDVSTSAVVVPKSGVSLEARLKYQRLSGFDEKGKPEYEHRTQIRKFNFDGEGEIVIPVLVPDSNEQDSFGIHEVLLKIGAVLLGRGPAAAFGGISVSADVPGAEILLDGGLVGRVAEGKATRLEHVSVGKKEIRIRDFSGREASRQVVVKKDKTAEILLKVLNLPPEEPRSPLLPVGKNPQGHDEYWRVQDGAIVVKIPGGEFLRGSPEGQGEPHERPQNRVHVSAFLIDKTEVTWRQFRKYAEATGSPLPAPPLWGTPDDYPASSILWEEAKGYCEWVGGRLPTEAEWEKAARGSDGRKYPWGDKWDHDSCNSRDGGPHRPLSAGRYRDCLSPYGVLDIAGNVWEWCSDWYGESYYAESEPQDPNGPAQGRTRVLRGGSWNSPGLWVRTAFRYKASPTYRNVHYGFRCVQNVPDS